MLLLCVLFIASSSTEAVFILFSFHSDVSIYWFISFNPPRQSLWLRGFFIPGGKVPTVLAFLIKYKTAIKWIVATILLVVACVGVHSWYTTQIQNAYDQGVAVTEQKWDKVMTQQKLQANQTKLENAYRVKELEQKLANMQNSMNNPTAFGGQAQANFQKSEAGQQSRIPDQVIDIYNESINSEVQQ